MTAVGFDPERTSMLAAHVRRGRSLELQENNHGERWSAR